MPEQSAAGAVTAHAPWYKQPYVHLAVMLSIVLWSLYGCDASAEEIDAFGNPTLNRLLEQIPLSLGLGYLLYRAFDGGFANNGKGGDSIVYMLVFLGAGILAGYVVMDMVSSFLNEDDEQAKRRKTMMEEIVQQSMIFGAMFWWLANYSGFFKRSDPTSWNDKGGFRQGSNLILISVVAIAILVCDIRCIAKQTDPMKAEHTFQVISCGLKILALAVITYFALRYEGTLTRQINSLTEDGDSTPLLSHSERYKEGLDNDFDVRQPSGGGGYGYEI